MCDLILSPLVIFIFNVHFRALSAWLQMPVSLPALWCGSSLWPVHRWGGGVPGEGGGRGEVWVGGSGVGVKFSKSQQSNQGVKPELIWYPSSVLITDCAKPQWKTHTHSCAKKTLLPILQSGLPLIVLELQVHYWLVLIIFKWTIMAVPPVSARSYARMAQAHFSVENISSLSASLSDRIICD